MAKSTKDKIANRRRKQPNKVRGTVKAANSPKISYKPGTSQETREAVETNADRRAKAGAIKQTNPKLGKGFVKNNQFKGGGKVLESLGIDPRELEAMNLNRAERKALMRRIMGTYKTVDVPGTIKAERGEPNTAYGGEDDGESYDDEPAGATTQGAPLDAEAAVDNVESEAPASFDYSSLDKLLESISSLFNPPNFKDSRYAGIGGSAYGGRYTPELIGWGSQPQWSTPFPSLGGGVYNKPTEDTVDPNNPDAKQNPYGSTSPFGMPNLNPNRYYGGQSNYYFGGSRSPYSSFGSQYGGGYPSYGGYNFYGGFQPFRFATNIMPSMNQQNKPSDAANQSQLSSL